MPDNVISISLGQIDDTLAGVPFDYIDTPVYDADLLERLGKQEVVRRLMADRSALPTTEAREGYFGDRHLEYWLSGYRDANCVVDATGLTSNRPIRILDFGGASGRVIRHFNYWYPEA